MVRRFVFPFLTVTLLAGQDASAACCRLVKLDRETPSSQVRVCDPNPDGGCGRVLFAGTLALGETHSVCAGAGTLIYQEFDASLEAYGPFTEAVCDGGDVEL